MKIAIDCDGVLADFDAAFIELIHKMYPSRLPANYVRTVWDWSDVLTERERNAVFDRIRRTSNWWLGLNAYPTEIGALARWFITAREHEVYVVTSRFPTPGMAVARQTDWWLRACGIQRLENYLGIIVVPESAAKSEIYLDLEFDYSIDDKGQTVEECDSNPHLNRWHSAFLLNRPWNRDAKVDLRVQSLDEFLDRIAPVAVDKP